MNTFRQLLIDPRRWSAVMGAVFFLSAGWIWYSAQSPPTGGGRPAASPTVGFTAPDFTLERMDGGTITLSELRGRVVMINLWASWCVPCRREMPAIDRVFQEKEEDGLIVLAVNSTYQDSLEAASHFVEAFELSFPVLLDPDGAVSRRYRLQALPTTFFVDKQGIIREVVFGGNLDEPLIESKIAALLAEESVP